MSFQLRDYQTLAVQRSVRFLQRPHSNGGGLVVLPTAAGKSPVIAGIVKALDAPCLVFQPSREILEQNANKLLAYGYEPSVYSASLGQKEIGTITLATIGSVYKTPGLFDAFPYVLIDECHGVSAEKGMYRDFLAALDGVRVLGLTATPYRLHTDGYGGSMLKFLTRTRPRLFTEVVAYAQIRELMAKGYLATPTYHAVTGFTRAALSLNSTGADYTDESVRRHYNRIGFAARLQKVVERLLQIGRRSVLVFTRFVDEAEALVRAVPGAAVVTAKTPDTERAQIVADFRSGKIPVVANVGVLTLGFDYPELATVVLARPTVSLGLYYQQVGRLMRPFPGKSPWVVDMVDQVGMFGRIEDLWLQPGGVSGAQWEMVTKVGAQTKVLTNQYFGDGPSSFQRKRLWRR